MDAGIFDVIVMVIGVCLIIAGIVLFVTGKLAGQNNKVEAFGIKMDVNNPSLLLVATGVGLVLVPRLLPSHHSPDQVSAPRPALVQSQTQGDSYADSSDFEDNASSAVVVPPQVPNATAASAASTESLETSLNWGNRVSAPTQLQQASGSPFQYTSYSLVAQFEDGEQISTQGRMAITPQQNGVFGFTVIYQESDGFGSVDTYSYQGSLRQSAGQWYMRITAGSDMEDYDKGDIPVHIESSGNQLGVSFMEDDSFYQQVWQPALDYPGTNVGNIR